MRHISQTRRSVTSRTHNDPSFSSSPSGVLSIALYHTNLSQRSEKYLFGCHNGSNRHFDAKEDQILSHIMVSFPKSRGSSLLAKMQSCVIPGIMGRNLLGRPTVMPLSGSFES